ncbi:unnamed protein product [Arabidopsis halleri]
MPRPKKVVPPTEIEITRQAIGDLQAQVQNLTAAIEAMNMRPVLPAVHQDREEVIDDEADSDVEDNPFAGGRGGRNNRRVEADSDKEEDDDHDDRWERGFKLEIPEFRGSNIAEELLDWFVTVEEILEFKRVPLDRCVPLIAIRFRDRAAAWWTQNKTSRTRLGKSKIVTWEKLKREMRKNFLPYNYDQLMFQRFQNLRQGNRTVEDYATEFFMMINRVDTHDSELQLVARFVGGLRQQIQHTLNLFQPLTISEAHQQALTVERQSRGANTFWSNMNGQTTTRTVPASTSPLLNEATVSTPTVQPHDFSSNGELSRTSRPSNVLKCFSCGEPGHRQASCPTRNRRGLLAEEFQADSKPVFDDDGDEAEYVVGDIGPLLMLSRGYLDDNTDGKSQKTEIFQSTCTHPSPYHLGWLKRGLEFRISRRVKILFSVGTDYHTKLYCDVVLMDVGHVILGRPWQFHHRVCHNGYTNTYSFIFRDRYVTLAPSRDHAGVLNEDLLSSKSTKREILISPTSDVIFQGHTKLAFGCEDEVLHFYSTTSSSPSKPNFDHSHHHALIFNGSQLATCVFFPKAISHVFKSFNIILCMLKKLLFQIRGRISST